MNKFFYVISAFAIFLLLCACENKPIQEQSIDEHTDVIGTSLFLAKVLVQTPFLTKSGEITEEEAKEFMMPIMDASLIYLKDNGYDINDDFDSADDPRIAWVAFGLAEYDKLNSLATKTSLGGCVLQAIGIAGLLEKYKEKAIKTLVKIIAKEVAKKAVPYIGAAITVGDFIWCMLDD